MTSSYGIKEHGLEGRVAVVTGATRGIGRAVAGRLAAAGALVCVTARDADEVRETARELGGVGLAGSVGDPGHPRDVAALALREFGRIDVVVGQQRGDEPALRAADGGRSRGLEGGVRGERRGAAAARAVCVGGWMREHGGSVVNICTEGAEHVGPNVGPDR